MTFRREIFKDRVELRFCLANVFAADKSGFLGNGPNGASRSALALS